MAFADAQKVLTGEVRFTFLAVLEPRAATPGAEPKFSATLLIPKSDTATKAAIDAAIQAAAQAAVSKTWGGARPPQLRHPVHDGDGLRPSGEPFNEEARGHWVLTANSKQKPQVVGINDINVGLSESEIYSGMRGRATIRFFGYSNSGNKGIGCGLGNILKTRDDEPLSGRAPASADFAGLVNSTPSPSMSASASASTSASAWDIPAASAWNIPASAPQPATDIPF
jgi:hypothetical protein